MRGAFDSAKVLGSHDSPNYEMFAVNNKSSAVQLMNHVFVYNLTNPAEVAAEGAKPVLHLVGPYVYAIDFRARTHARLAAGTLI